MESKAYFSLLTFSNFVVIKHYLPYSVYISKKIYFRATFFPRFIKVSEMCDSVRACLCLQLQN